MSALLPLIAAAVQRNLDGACGCVVSGGIDSSTITTLALRHDPDLPTFTGWYDEPGFDERAYARLVTGSNHHEVLITPQDFADHFDAMLPHFSPPYQGMGMFGQYMVAKHIGENFDLDAVLSGEGGDELFGGYARLLWVAGEPLPDGYDDYQLPDDYPRELAAALQYDWDRLPDLLAVDEQALGAFDMEARSPFLDEPVVEWVMRQPSSQRVGKQLLKHAVQGVVPDVILARRDKMGMPIPLVKWAQGPLRDFVGDRIGYVPDADKPWERGWFHDLLADGMRVAA